MEDSLKINKSSFVAYKTNKITEDYKLGKSLGEGSFGQVRKAVNRQTKQERAIKILKKKNQDEKQLFLEVSILSKLTHPNIMDIYEFYEDKANFYIVSEFCKGGELFDKIEEKGCFTEKEARNVFLQLLSAICYSHSNNIVHRDLKPENIMYEERKNSPPLIKLIDWGGARYFKKNQKMSTIRGTAYYIAPEVLKEVYDEKCDIWSCGVILYVLLCGYPPFNGDTDKEIMSNVQKGKFSFPPEDWDNISEDAKDLITKMLTFEPSKRISALDALQHAWFIDDGSNKNNKQVAKRAIENMKKFKRDKKFELATIIFIINQLTSKEDRDDLSKLFHSWDKNKDGVLSKDEIIEGYLSVYGTIDQDVVENMIKAVDTDGNGIIDYNEFLSCTMNRDKILSKKNLEIAFNTFDTDGNGSISIDEIISIFKKTNNNYDKKVFEQMMKSADSNGDGAIEFEEFQGIMEKFFQ